MVQALDLQFTDAAVSRAEDAEVADASKAAAMHPKLLLESVCAALCTKSCISDLAKSAGAAFSAAVPGDAAFSGAVPDEFSTTPDGAAMPAL